MFRIRAGNKRRKDGTDAVRGRLRLRPTIMQLEGRALLSTFMVNSTADDGSAGTLRWAIAQADANHQADTIDFSSLFNSPQTIRLTRGPLALTDTATTTITGPGENLLTISGNNTGRVFGITPGAVASLSGLTVTGGRVNGNGGGIENTGGTLALTDVVIRGNSARDGGGLFNNGRATLTDVVMRDNHARAGGGLFNNGSVTLTDVVIRGNTARVGSGMFSTRVATVNWRGLSNHVSTGQILFDNFNGTGTVPANWIQIPGTTGDIEEKPQNLTITDTSGASTGIISKLPSSVFSPLTVQTTLQVLINKVSADGNAIFGLFGLNGDGYLAAGIDVKGNVVVIVQQQSPKIPQTVVLVGQDTSYTGGKVLMNFVINSTGVEVTAPGFSSGEVSFSKQLSNFSLAAAFKDGAVPALVGASQPTTKGGSATFGSILVTTAALGRRR
jgi:hypothetical protein